MRFAVFSDIHGNLQALDVVLADIERHRPDRLICLGDLVGYGPDPNECVARVRASGADVVAGNHDHAAIGRVDVEEFNVVARAAIHWTHETLDPDVVEYLKNLPYVVTAQGLVAVHSSPADPEGWGYVLTPADAADALSAVAEPICFIGHSHLPGLYQMDGSEVRELEFPANREIALAPGARHLVNVGSVGQPRDGDPRAAWVLYDAGAATLTQNRLEYPVEVTQARIRALKLPPFLAERLSYGQ